MRDLQKQCYNIAKKNGHMETPDVLQLLLIASEVVEALENYEIDVSNRLMPVINRLTLAIKDLEFLRINVDVVDNSRLREKNNLPEELGDIVSRTMSFAEKIGVELKTTIENKNKINKNRPFKHGKKF